MKQILPAYKTIDMETWPRREHFAYYRNNIKCGYSVTVRADVTALAAFAKKKGLHFYGCFLYAASKTVNSMDCMKMMIPPEGGAGIWQVSNPNFTVFHKDDETFSDLWMEYQPQFSAFYREYGHVMQNYGDHHGIKGRPGQPANFFCISCVPWLDFSGYFTYSSGNAEPALFPILAFGKYTEQGGRLTLPVSLSISHAAADGYHSSQFFEKLQENLNDVENWI
ncbi:MAG: chloramphenicol acetyltransferase [Clostridia bacterium]|nr:chloramphenicol acetyltransferase [Clostridia bacterium]